MGYLFHGTLSFTTDIRNILIISTFFFKFIQELGHAYNYLNEAEILDAMRSKYRIWNGEHSQNIYDPIKQLVAPGLYNGDEMGQLNDGYLQPVTDGSGSSQDNGTSQEKTRTEGNLDNSTYGYLDPASIGSISVYNDNYLEAGQNAPTHEYTQPYQFSPAGYMAPISSMHRPHQSAVADPGFSRRLHHQNHMGSNQANLLPYFRKTPMIINNFGPRPGLRFPTQSSWIRQ